MSATAALAGPDSRVHVIVHVGDTETVAPGDPPTVCTFHLHFQPDVEGTAKAGYFDIHEGDKVGPIVADGLFDTTSGDSRAPATGVFALANGTYTVTWDDELVRDKSYDWQAIEVFCEEATPTPPTPPPPPTPTPSGSEQPIESETPVPSGSELPVESEAPPPSGNELPAGSVGGVTVTPPATDVSDPITGSTSSNVVLPVAVLLGLAAIFMTSSMRLRRALARRPSRRR